MAHARKTIREAVAGLVTGLTTTGSRVFQSRVYNVQETELPCLLVYTTGEQIEGDTLGEPRTLDRSLDLVIEGKAQAVADLDDLLDTIGEEVETAIGGTPALGINVDDTTIEAVEISFSGEGDKPIGSVLMRYKVLYRSNENAPGTII